MTPGDHVLIDAAATRTDSPKPAPVGEAIDLVRRFGALPSSNIGDAMDRMGVMHSAIRPLWPGAHLAGPAFTIWTRSGDNAAIHQALSQVRPGQVIVVNGQEDESRALIGELIAARAKRLGVAGFVLDGAARDVSGLHQLDMPVFARAVSPAGPFKNGPGYTECPIAAGGVAVIPGDLIVGDEDGVVVIPKDRAADVLAAAERVQADEQARMQAILA